MVLKHELPSVVFGEVKAARQQEKRRSHADTGGTAASLTEVHLLKTSNAVLGIDGMLHLGACGCVGQTPEVRTFTVRFRPLRDI